MTTSNPPTAVELLREAERRLRVTDDGTDWDFAETIAQALLKLAVEALENIEDADVLLLEVGRHGGLSVDGRMCFEDQTAHIAKAALSSLRPSVSAPSGDVEASRQSGG